MTPLELIERQVRERLSALPWKRILLPLDGTGGGVTALDRARRILRQPGTPSTLLRVVDCPESRARELRFRLDARHREAYASLAATRARLIEEALEPKALLRFGDPAEEILREIDEGGHDFVVMNRRSGGCGPLMGGVVDRVLEASPVPLLVCPPAATPRSASIFSRLLVVADGSEPEGELLPMAEGIARAFGSTLYVVQAVPGHVRVEELYGAWTRVLDSRGIPCRIHFATGNLVDEALAQVRGRALDSIALMTRSRVTRALIRDAGVPVLVWRRGQSGPALAPYEKHRQMWVE